MSLICIFHDRAELRHAEGVAAIVAEAGHTPWFANRDSHADWRSEIAATLARTDCLGSIVIWSLASTENPIVVDEAEATLLPQLCHLIAKKRRPPLVAVAERELGDGILERAKRVRSIRRALDRLGFKQPLHLLGTGNPLSMMILALAGGDIFDGLEWCRTVVDGNTMRLHHFHHFDLFLAQRSMIKDEFLREYLDNQDEVLPATAKAVLHNLYFFQDFEKELRQAHQQDSFEELFERYMPGEYKRIVRRINAEERL